MAKAEHWVEWLQGLDESSIWQASRLVTAPALDAGQARIPILQVKDPVMKHVTTETMDNDSKGQLFYDMFFSPMNPITDPTIQDYQYPLPQWKFRNITDDQIHCAITKLKPYKASRKGMVPNSVLIHTREDLIPYLGLLFHATNSLKYYPQEWALTETLILKKPSKPDYTSPAAW